MEANAYGVDPLAFGKEGGDTLHVPSMLDQIAHIIGKAIATGAKRGDLRTAYIDGRKSAFLSAAADLLSLNYNVDPFAAKRRLSLLVKDVRASWPLEDLLDEAKVGAEAHTLLAQALQD